MANISVFYSCRISVSASWQAASTRSVWNASEIGAQHIRRVQICSPKLSGQFIHSIILAQFTAYCFRSCPQCRVHSDYVIPSMFWVEEEDEKTLLIDMYKENTKKKICKYYKVDLSVINGELCEGNELLSCRQAKWKRRAHLGISVSTSTSCLTEASTLARVREFVAEFTFCRNSSCESASSFIHSLFNYHLPLQRWPGLRFPLVGRRGQSHGQCGAIHRGTLARFQFRLNLTATVIR